MVFPLLWVILAFNFLLTQLWLSRRFARDLPHTGRLSRHRRRNAW